MAVNVTPEVTAAHKNLSNLCEKFETSVDELCARSPQAIHPHEFYEWDCVPIAAACVDALSTLQSACPYEIAAYEAEVSEAGDTLRQQKRELEEKAAQRAKMYEAEVSEAGDTLRQQKRELEEKATQSIITIQSKVEEFSDAAETVGVNLSDFTGSERTCKKTTLESDSKLPYKKALSEATHAGNPSNYLKGFIIATISLTILVVIFLRPLYSFYTLDSDRLWGGILFSVFAATTVAIICYYRKKNKTAGALRILKAAAVKECNIIRKEMQDEVMNASAAHDKAVADIRAMKERDDKQAADTAANILATHDKKLNDAHTTREKAMAYINQEYQAFDTRLCQGLDKFQALVNTWKTKNIDVTYFLDENRIKNLGGNDERINPYLTRVGTVGIWGPFGVDQYGTEGNEIRSDGSIGEICNS